MYSCAVKPGDESDGLVYVVTEGNPSMSSSQTESGRIISGLVTIATFITATEGYPKDNETDEVVIVGTNWEHIGEEINRRIREISRDKYVAGLFRVTRLESAKFESLRLLVVEDATAGSEYGPVSPDWDLATP